MFRWFAGLSDGYEVKMKKRIVRDPSLAAEGKRKIAWVRKNMPVLRGIEDEYRKSLPFAGLNICVSVHLEAKTAYLALVLAAGGANVSVTGSNALSTKDDVVAALAALDLHVFAWHNATPEEFREHQLAALDIEPNIVIDDGGDLVHRLHEDRPDLLPGVLGACEETTAGILRNRARQESGLLKFPVVAVNDAQMKHLFDNRYGTGQSTWDAIMRTTNLTVTGKTVAIAGYGWCGRGIAERAAGLGAHVIVSEIDEIKAIEAVMDGYRVMPMVEAAKTADYIVTTTGVRDVLSKPEFSVMKDGVILANAGHFYDEIDVPALKKMAQESAEVRHNLTGYAVSDGRWINVVVDGKIVNISAGDGHPAEIMDTSFAVQALSARWVAQNHAGLAAEVIAVPREVDYDVARRKLRAMGVRLDVLTNAQKEYLRELER